MPSHFFRYAAVFAAFVAGMACLVGIDFSAKILASIAKSFEVLLFLFLLYKTDMANQFTICQLTFRVLKSLSFV